MAALRLLLVPLPVVLPPAVPLTRPRKRRRRRVHHPTYNQYLVQELTIATEKEESDDDMGFGLFD